MLQYFSPSFFQKNAKRIFVIDFFRGLALIAMFLFHFLWDLNFFRVTNLSLYSGFFGLFQLSILFSFIFISGVSFYLFSKNKNNFSKRWLNHLVVLFAAALGITIFTFLFFQDQFIYFGVIHLILFSWLVGFIFVSRPKFALLFGFLLIFLPLFFDLSLIDFGLFFWLGFGYFLPSLDFVPVVPWFGVFLVGLFFGGFIEKRASFFSKLNFQKRLLFVSLIGRSSLFFYLFHQFVLFPLAFLISLIF